MFLIGDVLYIALGQKAPKGAFCLFVGRDFAYYVSLRWDYIKKVYLAAALIIWLLLWELVTPN